MAARCPFLEQLEQMPRLTEARYADGLGELYAQTDPMEVARHIFDQAGDMPNSGGLSTLFTTWGQFLDHDLSLTPEGAHEHLTLGDRETSRSEAMEDTGTSSPREFGNAITWQIDGSQVYGSNATREADVRSFEGGKLKMIDDPTSTHGLLPLATDETVMAGDTSGDDAVFLAGDVRASENPNLLSLHTLFAREHNYWAERLAAEHPDWNDQDLFEVARSIVEFELQQITYNEWLPHLIGNALPADIAHDPEADGQISLEFSTAAFRFGHTMVSGHMPRLNEDGTIFGDGHLELLDNFFNPESVKTGGIDALIRGQAAAHAQEVDTKVIDDLNFFLATPDGVSGFSLPALNLIRGADHGMGSYLDVRAELLGDVDLASLEPTDFSIITADEELQAQLSGVYDTVFDVDLWVGGLAEDALPGTQMGPLFTHILSDQFFRTAAADETFGELDPRLGTTLLSEIASADLQNIILRNTDIDMLQEDPFLTAPRELSFEALITGTWEDDTLALAAVETPKSIFAEGGDDTVTLTGGTTIGGKLSLGVGADTVAMSSGATRHDIDMGRGEADEFVTLSGTARVGDDLITDGGDDHVHITDMAQIADDIETRGGDDWIEMSGTAGVGGTVKAGSGDDVILLLGGANAGNIAGGGGQDALIIDGREFRIEPTSDTEGSVIFLDAEGNETGEVLSYSGIETLGATGQASEGDDVLLSHELGAALSAGRGEDALFGRDGDDRLHGAAGDDTVHGGSGDDRVAGNSGDDHLKGGGGNDTLLGASGDDTLIGGAGDDLLKGGAGQDILTGGDGADTFEARMDQDGTLRVTDFADDDAIALRGLTEDDVIEILSADGDILLSSTANPNWRIILEDVEEFDETSLTYL